MSAIWSLSGANRTLSKPLGSDYVRGVHHLGRFWHNSEVFESANEFRLLTQSGRDLFAPSFSENDQGGTLYKLARSLSELTASTDQRRGTRIDLCRPTLRPRRQRFSPNRDQGSIPGRHRSAARERPVPGVDCRRQDTEPGHVGIARRRDPTCSWPDRTSKSHSAIQTPRGGLQR
jgi:hypothetical protein